MAIYKGRGLRRTNPADMWIFMTVTLRNQYEDLACASTPCHGVCKILTGFPLGEDLLISVLLSFLFNSFILAACLFLILESREARGLKLGARLSLCL